MNYQEANSVLSSAILSFQENDSVFLGQHLLGEAKNPSNNPPKKPGDVTVFDKSGKVSIVKDTDGTFTAVARSRSKNFKTYKGAVKWLMKNASISRPTWEDNE